VEECHIPRITASVLQIVNTDHGTTECLIPGSLGDISWVQKAASQLYIRNLPLLHTSTQHPGTSLHVISFTRPSLAFVLQAAKAWVRGSNLTATHNTGTTV